MSPSDLPRVGLEATKLGGAERAPALSKPPRKYLTPKERREMIARQGNTCACGCDKPLSTAKRGTVAEHTCPVACGNGEKPDHIRNRACASRKTYGGRDGDLWTPVGGDIRDIAHMKRIAEGRTQHDKRAKNGPKLRSNRKLQGAGFRKDVRRKFNGTTELVR